MMREKSPEAFRTISEVADDLDLPQHVLRFWETRFAQIRPMKRGGGRRYYRPEDVDLLRGIRHLLYEDGYTIKGVQRILKERGPRQIAQAIRGSQRAAEGSRTTRGNDRSESPEEAAVPHAAEPADDTADREIAAEDDPAAELTSSAEAQHHERRTSAPTGAQPTELARTLQSVLFELKECQRILEDARRQP